MNNEAQWGRTFRYTVGGLSFFALVAFLFYAHDAVRNLTIAAFVAYLINPAVDFLAAQTRMTRAAAVNMVYFTSLIMLVGVPAALTPILVIGFVTGIVVWAWHGNPYVGIVIALAMIANLLAAGFSGAAIPLAMRSLGLDPAQSSSIVLTTITDVVGFFSFLGFAMVFQSLLV